MNKANALTSLQERLLNEVYCQQGMNFAMAQWWNQQVVFADWWELYLHGFVRRSGYRNEVCITPAGVDYLTACGWI